MGTSNGHYLVLYTKAKSEVQSAQDGGLLKREQLGTSYRCDQFNWSTLCQLGRCYVPRMPANYRVPTTTYTKIIPTMITIWYLGGVNKCKTNYIVYSCIAKVKHGGAYGCLPFYMNVFCFLKTHFSSQYTLLLEC